MSLNLLSHAKSKLKSFRNLCTIPTIKDESKFLVAQLEASGKVAEEGLLHYSIISTKDKFPKLEQLLKYPISQDIHHPSSICNGLLLLLFHRSYDQYTGKMTKPGGEVLWNPTTGEFKILPPPPSNLDPRRCVKMSHGYFGFGFDSASEDYKVIRLLMLGDGKTDHYPCTPAVMAELYSLRTNSWKQVSLVHPFYSSRHNGVHVNGTYYWLNLSDPVFIMSFDFASEKFASSRVHLPPSEKLARDEYNDFKLVEYCGSLGAVVKSYEDTSNPFSSLEIWVWDGSKSSWSLVSTLDIPLSVGAYSLVGTDKLFLWNFKGDMMFFNCATSKLEKMSWVPTYPMDASHVFPFVENDVPLH